MTRLENFGQVNNLIENCESFNNCDPAMINADGFGTKLTSGDGNVYRNCKHTITLMTVGIAIQR